MRTRSVLVGAFLVALLTCGCAAGRTTVSSGTNACFRTIGLAANAAGTHGRLIGVDHRRGTRLQTLFPEDKFPRTEVCVVGFVRRPQPGVVIVTVDPHSRKVISVHRLAQSPIRFKELH